MRSVNRRVVIVGAGGIAFHGLSLLCTEKWFREAESVVVIDPDRMEARNRERQAWGVVGADKADEAITLVRQMCLRGGEQEAVCMTIEESWDGWMVHDAVEGGHRVSGQRAGMMGGYREVVFIVVPDNQLARVFVFDSVSAAMAAGHRGRVVVVAGSNGMESGEAYGGVYEAEEAQPDVAMWQESVWEEAKKEAEAGRIPGGHCARNLAVAEQHSVGNQLTAVCVVSTLRDLMEATAGTYAEWGWVMDNKGNCRVYRPFRGA